MSTRATFSSWKSYGFPSLFAYLEYGIAFDKKEFERISGGLIPAGMDDKWFIYAEGLVVYFCRSWTGHCIYKVRFEKVGGEYRVAEAMVNRDASQYSQIDDGYDARLLHFIIRGILLGERVAFPMAPLKNSEACAQEAYQHHVAGAAAEAQFRPSLLRRLLRRVCGR